MFQQVNSSNANQEIKITSKQEQIKLIDIIMEGLCVKELTHDGRTYLKRLRENLKFEIEMLQGSAGKKNTMS
jgi:hypothetical protein